jgi:hypothetical protein
MKRFPLPVYRLFQGQKRSFPNDVEKTEAIVLETTSAGQTSEGLHELIVMLQVMPKYERNFIFETKFYVTDERLLTLKNGSKINVTLHPGNPSRIELCPL